MTAPVFVDTNVLLYAHDADAGAKHEAARACLRELWEERTGCLSLQVLQEFYVNVTQKIARPLSRAAAREVLRTYGPWIKAPTTIATLLRGSELSELSRLSFWDGLIVAAAEEMGAKRLLSEDLQHNQLIAGVRITNPFKAAR
jgi:predicted nucleic acid-binding protein